MAELGVPPRWHLQPLREGAGRPAVTPSVPSCPAPPPALEQSAGQAGPLRADMTEQHVWVCPSLGSCLA